MSSWGKTPPLPGWAESDWDTCVCVPLLPFPQNWAAARPSQTLRWALRVIMEKTEHMLPLDGGTADRFGLQVAVKNQRPTIPLGSFSPPR